MLSIKAQRLAFLIFSQLLMSAALFAQHDPSDLLTSDNWDIIGTLNFKLEDDGDIYPIFSKELKHQANRYFELTGYLIPIKQGQKQSRFLLSTLPINQCFYCGKNGIPAMILVEMNKAIEFTYQPLKLKGTLKLLKVNVRDYPPIVLSNARPFK